MTQNNDLMPKDGRSPYLIKAEEINKMFKDLEKSMRKQIEDIRSKIVLALLKENMEEDRRHKRGGRFEMTLSDKRFQDRGFGLNPDEWKYSEEDVREFIKELKRICSVKDDKGRICSNKMLNKKIDKLAGDKLTKEGEDEK